MDQTRRSVLTAAALGAVAVMSEPARAQAGERIKPDASTRAGGPTEAFSALSADGTMLAVEAKGDPAAHEMLFIHGLRQSRLSWDKQFADPALAGLRLVRFDLRGHGDSDKPTGLEQSPIELNRRGFRPRR